jgi:hypothetical protein
VGTFPAVEAPGLAALVALAAGLTLVLVRSVMLRRRAIPADVARAVQAIPDALGDAVLAIDPAGRVAFADAAAAHLAGTSVADLVDRDVAEISPELAALARGLERGPATARFALSSPAGRVEVQAALVRVVARPPLALAVLRPLPPPAPPPLPQQAAPASARAHGPAARAALAATVEALRDPIAEAGEALSMLRLAATRLPSGADAALRRAEAALEAASRRLAEIGSAGEPGSAARRVDLGALVEESIAAFAAPAGVRIRADRGAAHAVADDRAVRAAVRELLAAAASALPAGGDVAVAVHEGAAPAVEIATAARVAPGGLALARALVAPQGGRVEDEAIPGRGWVVRLTLDGAGAPG